MIPALEPLDENNQRLMDAVHPSDWQNPEPQKRYNMVVIGGGTAGLVTAAISAGLGAKTALVEKELLGGDCLNVGCVPSKALIRSSQLAALVQRAAEFGIHSTGETKVNFEEIMSRMRRIRADISPHDSAERFSGLGIDLFLGQGKFLSQDEISVGDATLKFKRACIATGAKARVPSIPGLESSEFLTNETVFSLTQLPAKIAVIGGGPIGCELAQCFRRFGSEVFIFERSSSILSREDSDAATVVENSLVRDGITLVKNASITQVSSQSKTRTIRFSNPQGNDQSLEVTDILVATGRQPNTSGLGLENAGIKFEDQGIVTDDHLRTTNSRVFAAGDVTPQVKFTHAADFMARAVIQNAFFPWPKKKISRLVIPRATYASPELAQVGWTESELVETGQLDNHDVYRLEFADNDRAILDGQESGFVKVITRKGKDKVVGATVVGAKASELIGYFSLAMTHNMGLGKLGATIFPYPTHAEIVRKFGDLFNKSRFTPLKKSILRKWFG